MEIRLIHLAMILQDGAVSVLKQLDRELSDLSALYENRDGSAKTLSVLLPGQAQDGREGPMRLADIPFEVFVRPLQTQTKGISIAFNAFARPGRLKNPFQNKRLPIRFLKGRAITLHPIKITVQVRPDLSDASEAERGGLGADHRNGGIGMVKKAERSWRTTVFVEPLGD